MVEDIKIENVSKLNATLLERAGRDRMNMEIGETIRVVWVEGQVEG